MKNHFLVSAATLPVCVLFTLLVSGCAKPSTEPTTTTPVSTSLQLTVTDGAGVRQAGASVALYPSQTSYWTETGAVVSGTTDASGQITFSNLQPVRYWYSAKKGCLSNANSAVSTAAALPQNTVSTVSTTLASTGTLRFVNTSSNPYHVYVNGTAFPDMPGGTTATYTYELAGSYTIRVLQTSGYAVTPTDHSFQGTLSCGGTLTTTFP